MKKFTVEHKYCKCTKVIEGVDKYDAFKKSGTELNLWNIIKTEEN